MLVFLIRSKPFLEMRAFWFSDHTLRPTGIHALNINDLYKVCKPHKDISRHLDICFMCMKNDDMHFHLSLPCPLACGS